MTSIATATGQALIGVSILDTKFVVPPHSTSYFEITVGANPDDQHAARLLTRNRELYRQALDAENTLERVDCEWIARSLDGKAVRELLAIRRSV